MARRRQNKKRNKRGNNPTRASLRSAFTQSLKSSLRRKSDTINFKKKIKKLENLKNTLNSPYPNKNLVKKALNKAFKPSSNNIIVETLHRYHVCRKRQERKEVIHARKKTGRGSGKPRRTEKNKVRC